MGGKRVAGVIAIVLAAALAAFDVLYYMVRHPRRGPIILVVCGVLLVLGIVLAVTRGGASKTQPGA